MAYQLDAQNPTHQQTERLLRERQIGWLTTTGVTGLPHAVPVWFWWDDGEVVIVSEPDTAKTRHLRDRPECGFHLETGQGGNEVVIFTGSATVSDRATAAWMAQHEREYAAKYAAAIESYGMPLEGIVEQFSTIIRFTPTKLLAW